MGSFGVVGLILQICFWSLFQYSNAYPTLIVTSDEIAVLDSPLNFYAVLKNPEKSEYIISWQENWPYERDKQTSLNAANNFTSNWTLTYWSTDNYQGKFSITVSVYYKFVGLLVNVDTQLSYYTITNHFVGELDVWQSGRKHPSPFRIATANQTEIVADIHDPSNYLKTADNVTFSWWNETGLIANTTENKVNLTFPKEGNYYINVTLSAVFNATTNNSAVKTGVLETNITAKVAILNLTVTGPTWFPHGKLLDLNVSCAGSGPYTYCWQLKSAPYNQTGNETCVMPSVTNDCEFPITRYFQQPGIYTLLVIIGNDVSRVVNQSTINVYIVHRKQQLSIIVVPVLSSIVAIVLIIFGVAYYLEHQVKYNIEVADFDFGQDTELPYVSFLQRVKNAFSTSGNSSTLLVPSLSDEEPSLTRYGTIKKTSKSQYK